jgi:eukaryotic-like serine/threonine-protein kinase
MDEQMTPERWQQIEKLFYAALEHGRDERTAFLAEACAGDEALRQEVESLLASHEQGAGAFEALTREVAAGLLVANKARTMKGRMLGRYKLLSALGAGGMGEVYRALDTRLDREVAVKILPLHLAANPEALVRFEREAKAVAALSHPNILAIHDVGADQGLNYAVMELLKGETLRNCLARGALPWRKAVVIGVEMAEGLAAAHAKGITHRDLKPENIFLTSGDRTKILDFGLARFKRASSAENITSAPTEPLVTDPGMVMGTVGYMSPEQVRGEEADAPSDIFSFGCVLYEMVTGQRAFAQRNAAESLAAILRDDPPELADSGKKLPVELGRVITRCLEKNPAERFHSACDLAFALESIVSGSSKTISFPAPTALRARGIVSIAAVLLLLLFGLAWYLYSNSSKSVSLVVLPFTDGKDSEYILDGITESIINSLSQLPQLRVIARTTAFSYKERAVDLKKLGSELGVQAVATGKVVLQGDSLSVQADLIDVATGSQIWGDKYERKRTDILTVQAEIAREIAEKLRLRLTGEQRQRLVERYTQNTDAYDLYLRGRFHLEKRADDEIYKGIEFFKQAKAKDPNFALAYVGLADAYILNGGGLPPTEAMLTVRGAATKALELDGMLAEAHTSLAVVSFLSDWDWSGAENRFRQAIALKPGYATAYHWYAEYLTAMGRHNQAFAAIKQAEVLDPLSPIISRDVGWHYYCAGNYDQAIVQCQKTLKLEPNFVRAHVLLGLAYAKKKMFVEAIDELQKAMALNQSSHNSAQLGYAYALAGQRDKARQILDALNEQTKKTYVSPDSFAVIYSGLGDKDRAFAWLEKSLAEHSDSLVYLKVRPTLDSLRSDPRFHDLVRRIGLPE